MIGFLALLGLAGLWCCATVIAVLTLDNVWPNWESDAEQAAKRHYEWLKNKIFPNE